MGISPISSSPPQQMVKSAFQMLDENGDSKLNASEVGSSFDFCAADKNGDGKVSQTEYNTRPAANPQQKVDIKA
jgi:hypothetical protein